MCGGCYVLTLSQILLEHLESPNSYARTLFIDFSSAFNTIKPSLLLDKLKSLGVSDSLCNFIRDFLQDRSQRVRIGNYFSDIIVINTGSPQGCVLSAVLFILYTNNLISISPNCYVIKYADDTAIIGLFNSSDTNSYIDEVNSISEWCTANNLLLNVSKTKEIIFDFRRKDHKHDPIIIDNSAVSIVDSYKYLGTIIDQDLSWADHVNYVFSKCQQRLYFLRSLSKFHVSSTILHLFYSSVIQSILTFGCLIWWNNATHYNKYKLSKICKNACKITKCDLSSLQLIYEKRVRDKVERLCGDADHPLHQFYRFMQSGKRLRALPCRTKRYRDSFIPNSIHVFNMS